MAGADDRAPSRIERLCTERGLRMTGQRRTIARVLSESEDHPDVVEVFRRAHEVDKRISLSTVYRTLKLFEAEGILERHDFVEGRRRYQEAKSNHHQHLIDLGAGNVIASSNEAIERLQARIARELGLAPVGHRLDGHGRPLRRKKT